MEEFESFDWYEMPDPRFSRDAAIQRPKPRVAGMHPIISSFLSFDMLIHNAGSCCYYIHVLLVEGRSLMYQEPDVVDRRQPDIPCRDCTNTA